MTVVSYQGNSFTSRQAVPAGIDITNETYWAQTGNYNAQIETYRQEVQTFDSRIDALEDALPISQFDSTDTVNAAISAETSARQTAVSNEATARQNADTALGNRIDALYASDGQMVVIGDSWSHHYNAEATAGMWDTRVATALHLENHNYATGSVGYMRDLTNCFYDQLTAAGNDSSVDPTKVRKVFIVGGLNDVYRSDVTYSLFNTSVNQTLAHAQTLFPYSEIIVAGIQRYQGGNVAYNDSAQYLGFDKISLFTAVLFDSATNNLNNFRLVDLRYMGLFTVNFYQQDGHPTLTRGHRTFASKMLGGTQSANGSTGNFFGEDAYKPTITLNGVTTRADRCVAGLQGNGLVTLSFLFFVDPANMATGTTGTIDLRGAPHPPVWPRILGVDTCEITTIDPQYANQTIADKGANETQWCNTYNFPYLRGSLKTNGLFELTYSIQL